MQPLLIRSFFRAVDKASVTAGVDSNKTPYLVPRFHGVATAYQIQLMIMLTES